MAILNIASKSCEQKGYSHKKFDCGYKHKKFDRVLRRKERKQQLSKNTQVNSFLTKEPSLTSTELGTTARNLFRPYALDATLTPRKRKMEAVIAPMQKVTKYKERVHVESVKIIPAYQQYSQTMPWLKGKIQHQQQQQQQPFAIDKRALALMLQKQREVLYMRNFMQFNGNGNGWPTLLTPAPIMGNIC